MNRIHSIAAVLLLAVGAWLCSGHVALAQARVSAEKQTYSFSEPITVQWSGLPARQNGWIVVGRPGTDMMGSEHQAHSLSNYNGEVSSGRHTFRGFPPGTYEIRLVLPPYGSETTIARATITVAAAGQAGPGGQGAALDPGAPSLKSDKQVYEQLEEIKVSWSNISLVNGWVGIGKRGEAAFSFRDREPSQSLPSNWQGRPASGNFSFPGRIAGEYELRIVTGDINAPQVLLRAPITVKE